MTVRKVQLAWRVLYQGGSQPKELFMLDDIDRALIHALIIDGRAPFNRIADVLQISPQTVARRYQRLRMEAGLRVVGIPEPQRAGEAQWLMRLTVNPRSAVEIAQSLVRRPDTSWVKLTSGGTEIIAIVNTSASSSSHSLLLRYVPRTANISSVSAHYLLHTYLGGATFWRGGSALKEEQVRMLMQSAKDVTDTSPRPDHQVTRGNRKASDEADHKLLMALAQDGRASLADLAAATGFSPVTVAHRLADLQASGAIFFDVEIDPALLGAPTQVLMWMSVTPACLDSVGTALAKERELAFVASTTGPTNLIINALCRDPADMHSFIAERLGALPEIMSLETSPVLQTLKASSPSAPTEPIPHRDWMVRRGGPQG
jgi:DNA-binding Lrp family transcriptional regulator